MIIFIPILTACFVMLVSYFVFFVNIMKLQAHLRSVDSDLPPEYLYLNTMLMSAAKVGGKSLVSEIKDGGLSGLSDKKVDSLCRGVIASEKVFKISAVAFICLLLAGFSLLAWVMSK